MNPMRLLRARSPKALAMQPKSTNELIADIEHADRRFRVAQTIFFSVVIVALGVIIAVQFTTISAQQENLTDRQKAVETLQQSIADEQGKQTRYIQCLARFFATADRDNLVLEDLDSCSYQQNGDPVPGVDLTPTDQSNDTTATEPAQEPATSEPTTPATPATPAEPAQPAQSTEPVRVLGLPVCVPLLNVCVEQ